MRRVAIKWDQATIDADGHIAGHDAGATLVRRLVRLTHNPIVIGPATRRCDGFDEMPLAFLDTDACVVINMDVLDSTKIWCVLRENSSHPAVMNFQWGPTTNYDEQVPQLIEALSFGLFPTFANSERTASAVREVVRRWTVADVAEKARVGWASGSNTSSPAPPQSARSCCTRRSTSPSASVPRLFVEVVEKVHRKVPSGSRCGCTSRTWSPNSAWPCPARTGSGSAR